MTINNESNKLNILQWNAQSILPKLPKLDNILNKNEIHIAILQETWLIKHIKITNYTIYRKDRDDGFGGVAFIIHNSIAWSEVGVNIDNLYPIEAIAAIKLTCYKNKINIFNYYCIPRKINPESWEKIISAKDDELTLICGDAHHPYFGS